MKEFIKRNAYKLSIFTICLIFVFAAAYGGKEFWVLSGSFFLYKYLEKDFQYNLLKKEKSFFYRRGKLIYHVRKDVEQEAVILFGQLTPEIGVETEEQKEENLARIFQN